MKASLRSSSSASCSSVHSGSPSPALPLRRASVAEPGAVGPAGADVGFAAEQVLLLGALHRVADGGRALEGDPLALLVDVEGVAPLEARRAGELGVGHLVVERHAVADQLVARPDAGPEEPPLVAAEDQVRAGDLADLGRRRAVAGVAGDGERLRGEDLAPPALGRPPLVVVQRVGVVHGLHPAPDVVERHGLLQLAGPHGHAHVLVEVGHVERGARWPARSGGLVGAHRSPSAGVTPAVASRACTSSSRASSRTLASLPVMGISSSSKNRTCLGTL